MKRLYSHFLFIIVLFFVLHSNVNSQDLTPEQIYEKVNNCVVVILSYDFDGKLSKQGSGVVISDKGWVVTNYHVFAECEKVEIRHNDKLISYTDIIGVDIEKDILILKIEENTFPSIPIASSENLRVGQRVYAIGSPLGMENSLSEGLISGLRNVTKKNKDYIQITAGISPGSSGGAVVNSKGQLIGISSSSLEGGQNLNFAIPVDDIMNIAIDSYSNEKDINANNNFFKGYNALGNENYREAITYFTKYLKIFPNDAPAYFNRGLCYYYLDEFNYALLDFDKAININPFDSEFYNLRGKTYGKLSDSKKSLSDFNKAIEIEPNNSEAFNNRGLIYRLFKNYQNAMSDFNKAIEIEPRNAQFYRNRGDLYNFLREIKNAIIDYSNAINVDPEYYYLYYLRGTSYSSLKDFNKAILDFDKAVRLDPEFSLAYNGRGNAYSNLQDFKNAILDYNISISLNPDFGITYYNRGLAYYNLKDYNKACEDVRKAYSLGYNSAIEFINEICR